MYDQWTLLRKVLWLSVIESFVVTCATYQKGARHKDISQLALWQPPYLSDHVNSQKLGIALLRLLDVIRDLIRRAGLRGRLVGHRQESICRSQRHPRALLLQTG